LDLNRTILFVNQQYGVTVNRGIWLFGPAADQQVEAIQKHTQLPVQVSPLEYEPFYWATEAARLRPTLAPNFISPELQKAPQRQVFAKVVAATAIFVLLASLSLSAYSHYQARQETSNIKLLASQLDRLQTQRSELQRRNDKLDRDQQISQLVLDRRPSPVPVWFLGYLSEAVPNELVVTNLHIKQESGLWKVHLAGTCQSVGGQLAPESFSKATGLLADRLANGPFHLKLLRAIEPEADVSPSAKGSSPGNSIQDWLAGLSLKASSPTPAAANQFVVEGTLR
jgi:hypothetical protein